MALLQDELKVRKVQELLGMNLALPSYQRAYSWSVKSTNTLFMDTYNAYQEGIQEYRIGSVILHKEYGKYNIVDGQQRLIVPIYQRNYAWGEIQIEQLIEDIHSSIDDHHKNYFLGNLIVNQTDHNVYEVIDGQQRLTTLFLLGKYLEMSFAKDALRFEAREKSNRTLHMINNGSKTELLEELRSTEILNGYEIIDNYLKAKGIDKNEIIKKLGKVFLIRVQVPQDIDLNHYFEVMNTRGEQLELHEIAKARFLEALDSEHDKKIGALIWEKCSDMDSYIQMNFDSKLGRSFSLKIGLVLRIKLIVLIQLENMSQMMKMTKINFL